MNDVRHSIAGAFKQAKHAREVNWLKTTLEEQTAFERAMSASVRDVHREQARPRLRLTGGAA